MEDILGLKGHRCLGCGVSLPEWQPVCDCCAGRNRREEADGWRLDRETERGLSRRLIAGHPGRMGFLAGALQRTRRGDEHEKA